MTPWRILTSRHETGSAHNSSIHYPICPIFLMLHEGSVLNTFPRVLEMGVAKRLYSAPWKNGNSKPRLPVYRRCTKLGAHVYLIETHKKVSWSFTGNPTGSPPFCFYSVKMAILWSFHASYFNELLLQFSSNLLQTVHASSEDLFDQKLSRECCIFNSALP